MNKNTTITTDTIATSADSFDLQPFFTALAAWAYHNLDDAFAVCAYPYVMHDAATMWHQWERANGGKHPEGCICWRCTDMLPGCV